MIFHYKAYWISRQFKSNTKDCWIVVGRFNRCSFNSTVSRWVDFNNCSIYNNFCFTESIFKLVWEFALSRKGRAISVHYVKLLIIYYMLSSCQLQKCQVKCMGLAVRLVKTNTANYPIFSTKETRASHGIDWIKYYLFKDTEAYS